MEERKAAAIAVVVSDIILVGAGVVCLFALAYFVYYYGWTGQRQFTHWSGALLYYISPALLAVFLFGSIRLRESRRINLSLAVFSAGVSIYALEVLLTLWSNLPSVVAELGRKERARAAKVLGIDFDTRTRTQVIDDLRRRGIDAVPSVFAQALLREQSDGTMKSLLSINGAEVLPLAGIANKLVVMCNEGGQFSSYRSDEHGFHNPRNLWDAAPIDIVAVGDSFVQGACVPPDRNFVALIRRRHPATLNLGIENNGPLVMLATIKEYAQIVRPKAVLWFYFEGNDLADLSKEKRHPLLGRYLMDGFSQGLFVRQVEIDRVLDEYVEKIRDKNEIVIKLEEIAEVVKHLPAKTKSILALSEARRRFGLIRGATDRSRNAAPGSALPERKLAQIELLGKILSQARDSVSPWGGQIYFVYLPGRTRYASKENSTYQDRDLVLQAAIAAGLPVIDIHRSFMAQRDPLDLFPLRVGYHYNEEGHRLVAEEVLRSISLAR